MLKTSDLQSGDFRIQVSRSKLHISGIIDGLHKLGPQELSDIISDAFRKIEQAIEVKS